MENLCSRQCKFVKRKVTAQWDIAAALSNNMLKLRIYILYSSAVY